MQKTGSQTNLTLSKYLWYLHRARGMGAPEILHRGLEQLRRVRWRRYRAGWRNFELPSGPLKPLDALVSALSEPWPPHVLEDVKKAVDRVEDGKLNFLGVPWPDQSPALQDSDLWLSDPVTSYKWPGEEVFCFDVQYRHLEEPHDVKFIWELNRLQFLQPVAALSLVEHTPHRVAWLMEVLLSWMLANPPFRGVNWASGIEVALRLVSVAFVVSCVSDKLSSEQIKKLRSFVAAHMFWLHRNPSLYSSANNHRIAEGLGQVIGALLVPDLPLSPKCLSEGAAILRDAPSTQFHLDGVGMEQSPAYAAFTLEMLAVGALALSHAPAELKMDCSLLIRPAWALRALLDDNGIAPNIGDNDEGRVIVGSATLEPRYIASVVAAVSGLCDPELAPAPRDIVLRDVVLRSPRGNLPPTESLTHFLQGGYSIFHGSMAGRKVHLTFDYGPLGFEPIAAHGHADALAIWLTIDNHPIFVDAGTYRYHAYGQSREFFRSSAAHNTLQVAGESQSSTSGAFNWRHKAVCYPIIMKQHEDWQFQACHEGFLGRFGIVHERTVRRAGNDFVISDRLIGAKTPVDIEISFLLSPQVIAGFDRGEVVLQRGGTSLLRISPPLCTNASCTDFSLAIAQFSPRFGELSSTKQIAIRAKAGANAEIVTRIHVIST